MNASTEVEGYTNYATFGVAVTLDNERTHHTRVRNVARNISRTIASHANVKAGIWTEEQAAKFQLADFLKSYTEDLCEAGATGLMAQQMVQAGLSEVDWHELAADLLNEES